MAVAYRWKTSACAGARLRSALPPFVYRCIDWSVTVQLQMVEFYLVLSAAQPGLSPAMFWRLVLPVLPGWLPDNAVNLYGNSSYSRKA